MNAMKSLLKILLPLFILAVGGMGGWTLYQSKIKVKRSRPQGRPPLVEVTVLQKGELPIVLRAMGTVKPEKTIALKPEVAGRVQEMSLDFAPGGIFKRGERILSLDPADFELTLAKQRALVARARASLDLENGRQEVAREDLALMETTTGRALTNTDLVLRKPHLAQARADLASVRADLDQAELNLKRTQIHVPFNAMVLERNVNRGSRVNISEALATLVGTDVAWVETSLPVDKLPLVQFADKNGPMGSPVKVMGNAGSHRKGHVLRLRGRINPDTRMATVIVAVSDPFALDDSMGHQPLLLESYVEVEIQGRPMEDAVAIPRSAFHNNGQIWLFVDGTLEKRNVEPVFFDADHVYVTRGVNAGELLIVSDLATPVEGMSLRRAGASSGPDGQGKAAPPTPGAKGKRGRRP